MDQSKRAAKGQRPPTVIEFAAPPDLVLGAALQGQPLPAPSAELHFIVVDPGVAVHALVWKIGDMLMHMGALREAAVRACDELARPRTPDGLGGVQVE